MSILNISEKAFGDMNLARFKARRLMIDDDKPMKDRETIFYDNLDSMQMALDAGDIDVMEIPRSTADYLIANNDKMEILDPAEKNEGLNEEEQEFLKRLYSTGFAFMMREDSEKLRDAFDDVLDDMKEDGTLDKLIKEYITDVIAGKEPKAVEFELSSIKSIFCLWLYVIW